MNSEDRYKTCKCLNDEIVYTSTDLGDVAAQLRLEGKSGCIVISPNLYFYLGFHGKMFYSKVYKALIVNAARCDDITLDELITEAAKARCDIEVSFK